MNILVVDDDHAIRESLDRSLPANGYDVELASGGTEALRAIERAPFDAVVLDVLMPGRAPSPSSSQRAPSRPSACCRRPRPRPPAGS
jgi:CheY-like chemotaxis protein